MKFKSLVISTVMLAASIFAGCAAPAHAQTRTPEVAKAIPNSRVQISDSKSEDAKAVAAPELKAEDLLKIRDLQFQQARRLMQQQQMVREYEALQKQIEESREALRGAVDVALKDVDRAKWDFDAETLKLIPHANPPAPATSAAPPKGGPPNSNRN